MNALNEYGQKEGPWESFYPNGQLHYRGSYSKGFAEGPWEVYSYNGDPCFIGTYTKGDPDQVTFSIHKK